MSCKPYYKDNEQWRESTNCGLLNVLQKYI